ncbi:MAG: NifU family protein [Acidimicrobiia bacterium]|nr:NifU family protein [Acidimicrobiia bacterium]
MSDEPPGTLQDLLAEIQQLVDRLDEFPDPEVRRTMFRLLDLIDMLHRTGMERLVGGLASAGMLDKALDDPLVAHLFDIYGLVGGEDPAVLVTRGLDEVRGYVQSHGGDVTFDRVEGGTVYLELLGACVGCPSSEVTIGQSIEEAIRRHWAGLVRVVTKSPVPSVMVSTPLTLTKKSERSG